jgi:hypothetical protein
MITVTSGHGDFRQSFEVPRTLGQPRSRMEQREKRPDSKGGRSIASNKRHEVVNLGTVEIREDAVHWSLMAWSKRRISSLLVASGLVAFIALCLLKAEGKPGRLHNAYVRIRVGMPAGEVCDILSEDWRHSPAVQKQVRAAFLAGARPRSVWPLRQEQGGVCEEMYVSYDANLSVSHKRYDSGSSLKYLWWLDDLVRKFHW